MSNVLKDEVILKNINYDYSKKIVLEELLGVTGEYIFSEPNDINFMYNYKIKYITIPIDKLFSKEILNEINRTKNTEELISFLNKMNIIYYMVEKDIRDIKKNKQ